MIERKPGSKKKMSQELKILMYPDKLLLKKAEPVESTEEAFDIIGLLSAALNTDLWANPSGMAAPQIGRSKQLFIALGEVFINPTVELLPKGGDQLGKEGCYSLPAYEWWMVLRRHAIKVDWQTPDMKFHTKIFTGNKSRVIQHENDHLQGVMCNQHGTLAFKPKSGIELKEKKNG